MNIYDNRFKFIIVGDSSVGKSCLLLQFTESRFTNKHDPTIGVEFGQKILKINDKQIKLQFWDTAGQEQFGSLSRSYYIGSNGGILVFDVTNRKSFENLQKWYYKIEDYVCDEIEMVIVGNKIDLDERREVKSEEAKNYAQKLGFKYFETSAKTGENVDNVFQIMVHSVLKKIDSGKIDPTSAKPQIVTTNQNQSVCC